MIVTIECSVLLIPLAIKEAYIIEECGDFLLCYKNVKK